MLDLFQEVVVEKLPTIREVVNTGRRTFRDVIRLVEKGQRFQEWLVKHGNDKDLRSSYCQDVSRVDWADKLPPKSVRWLIVSAATTALGFIGGPVAGTAAATALSAADFFLLDKMLKGWKLNHFIEGPLKQFLSVSSDRAPSNIFIPGATDTNDTRPSR